MEDGETLARDVLNALSANIAVLDPNGVIVEVNDAWKEFARANGGAEEHFYVGMNYLSVCENALADGDDDLEELTNGLRALIAGEEGQVSIEYDCDSPAGRRSFLVKATRLRGGSGPGIVVAHEDITVRKRIEQALRETERTLFAVLEALPVGVWIMDRTGRIVHGNPEGQRIWGGARYVPPEEFGEYKAWWLDTGLPIAADDWAGARAIREGEISIGEKIEIGCFDGTRRIILNSGIPLFDEQHAVQGAIIVNQDITAREQDEVELRRAKEAVEATSRELADALARERVLARVDALTGATNRGHFGELAEHQLAVAVRYQQPLSLILFDVDDLKRINDTLGHQAGDRILRRIGALGREHLRGSNVFARYGGDEFVVLLPNTDAAEAGIVAERLRQAVAAESVVLERGVVPVTISSGISELSSPDDTLDTLVHRADVALYEAKKGGRNRTALFQGDVASA